jgi:hypothetical protein
VSDALTGYPPRAEAPTGDHLGRTDKDFAIEFGEYLAKAADATLALRDDMDPDEITETWERLRSAVHEFRKRARRAVT